MQTVQIVYRDKQRMLPWTADTGHHHASGPRGRYGRYWQSGSFDDGMWPFVQCVSLGPGLPDNRKLARFWDRVVLTEEENLSIQALRLAREGIERVALVGDARPGYQGADRRVVVKLEEHARPVPLRSLGGGATRLFAAGLALANSRSGFLLVDEAENGIHYSVYRAFWGIVLQTAQELNGQVLATTQSRDCVMGFAFAASQINDADGVFVRLERDHHQVRAFEYTEEDLVTAAEQDIEIR